MKTNVLNGQGWIRVVDTLGGDGSVVEAARVTTGKGRSVHKWAEGKCSVCGMSPPSGSEYCVEGDRRFLSYLMKHNHASPFEFAELVIHVRCPIMVFRQWVRHWSWSYQEYSGRYSEMIDDMLVTNPEEWRKQSETNRQGSGGMVEEWPEKIPEDWRGFASPGHYLSAVEQHLQDTAREVYQERLAFGVAREQARKDLPLSTFTEVYAKVNLRDLFSFIQLRTDSHAQQEIRVYADALAEIVREWCPRSWEAFEEHRLRAVTLSRTEAQILHHLLPEGDPLRKKLAGR